MYVVWYMVVDHVGETLRYYSHATLLFGRKTKKVDVGINKYYFIYGPCSILSNHKLIAILWWNGTHRNYVLSICRDYFENAVRIQRTPLRSRSYCSIVSTKYAV
jgi:hypothetical protein